MTRRMLALFIAAALLAAASAPVHAKAPSLIISGGELGQDAAFFGPGDPGWMEIPGEGATLTPAPAALPAVSYDLYRPQWLFHAAQAATSGRADAHYYPEARLMYDSATNAWYKIAPETAASLQTAIDGALLGKAAGGLDPSVAAAELRGRGLVEATFWLRPFESTPGLEYWTPPLSTCETCAVLGTDGNDFATNDLLPMISQSPEEGAAEGSPKFLIEYSGGLNSGLVGAYAPPGDGRPGRFWPALFSSSSIPNAASYPTTPAFDRAVAEAFETPGETPLTPLALVVAAAIVLAGLAIMGTVKAVPRRSAGRETARQSLR